LGRAGSKPGEHETVRRTTIFIALWLAAGAAAAIVAWLGVSTVNEQLAGSGSHPDPLTAEEIAAQAAEASTTTTTTLETSTTTSSTTSTTVPPDSTPSTTVGSTPTTQVAPPTTVAPAAVVRSYDLVGGSATLRFTPSGVTVVVATPKPGFTVDISEAHSGGARVEFESDDHRSRVDGWWDGGPQDEVREDD
jgi:hypothetical protein